MASARCDSDGWKEVVAVGRQFVVIGRLTHSNGRRTVALFTSKTDLLGSGTGCWQHAQQWQQPPLVARTTAVLLEAVVKFGPKPDWRFKRRGSLGTRTKTTQFLHAPLPLLMKGEEEEQRFLRQGRWN